MPRVKGSTKFVTAGVNDIATTHPHIVPWLTNIIDANTKQAGTASILDLTCPDCQYAFQRQVRKATQDPLRCPMCSGGSSFPERFVSALLCELNISFLPQKIFSWNPRKKYDFYIPSTNTIIEVNGAQHYVNGFMNLTVRNVSEQMRIDRSKRLAALENGIAYYIRIDARVSDPDYIRNSICRSKLSILYDLLDIDWQKINISACRTSKVLLAAKLWNDGFGKTSIAKQICSSGSTVTSYLQRASAIGLCDYSVQASFARRDKATTIAQGISCACVTTQEAFSSINSAARAYSLSNGNLCQCLQKKTRYCGIYHITKEPLIWEYFDAKKHIDFVFVS